MKSFIKFSTILFLNVMAFFSLICFSATDVKNEEKLICNKYCQSTERIQISHINGTEIDLSGTKDIIKNIIDKKMKVSGNVNYGANPDPRPGGTLSYYSKVEKDSKKLLTRTSGKELSSSLIQVAVIFRQNDCDKNAIDIYIRSLASSYIFFNIVKCNGKDSVSCVSAALTDFAKNELSEHLFKEPIKYEL